MLKKLDKKGVISIIYVIMIFISVIIVMGFVSITNKTIAINETQGIMDVAGVMALRKSVDETEWRLENLVVDKSKAAIEYRKIVNENISDYVGNDKLLKDFKLTNVNVYKGEDTALGDIQGKEQYYLEATGVATYSTYSYVDRSTFNAVTFFDFLNTGEYSTIAIGGVNEDGDVEVVIRTVSRLALR